MKIFVTLFAIIAVAYAAPQSLSNPQYSAAPQPSSNPDASAETLKSNADVGIDAYSYEYETSNQIKANENGQLKQIGEESGIVAQGAYSYVDPDGNTHSISYVADENGFQPQGDLPTPPPIPEAIQRALEYIAAHPPAQESRR